MIDKKLAIVVQSLLYFTHIVSKAIHGFMQKYATNETTELKNNKAKQVRK